MASKKQTSSQKTSYLYYCLTEKEPVTLGKFHIFISLECSY